jgi:hypothetical protein
MLAALAMSIIAIKRTAIRIVLVFLMYGARCARCTIKRTAPRIVLVSFDVWRSLRSHSYKKDWQPASY